MSGSVDSVSLRSSFRFVTQIYWGMGVYYSVTGQTLKTRFLNQFQEHSKVLRSYNNSFFSAICCLTLEQLG